MFPAIERRSGRSRYTSATRSSSITATRCSPMSTEISSSRFAAGSGARRGGWRRRWRCRPDRCAAGRLPAPRAGSARASRAPAPWRRLLGLSPRLGGRRRPAGRLRPRPPRLPRRRRFSAAPRRPHRRGRVRCCALSVLGFRLSRSEREPLSLRPRARPARPSCSSIGTRASSASPRCSARGRMASHRDAGLAQRMSKTMAMIIGPRAAGYQWRGEATGSASTRASRQAAAGRSRARRARTARRR